MSMDTPRHGPASRSIVMLLQSFHPVVGGAEQQALQLSRVLISRGMDVRVVTRSLPGLPPHDRIEGVSVRRLPTWGPLSVSTVIFAIASFAWLLWNGRRGDIVHVHLAASHAIAAALAGRLGGMPVIVKIGGAAGIGEIGAAGASLAGRLKLVALRALRPRLVVLNDDHVAELQAAGLGQLDVSRIENGVDVRLHHPAAPGEKAARAKELGCSALVVLSAGRLANDKGQLAALRAFLDAWKGFAVAHPEARFLLAGSGPEEATVRGEIAARGLEGSAHLLGHRRDVSELLRAADAFVLLSLAEGMSNAVLEAMASALPILGPRVSGVVGLVEDGVHGVLFDPTSAAEAGGALTWLAADPARAAAAGRRGRELAEAHSIERSAQRYLELYERTN